jgi:hypothetical protein
MHVHFMSRPALGCNTTGPLRCVRNSGLDNSGSTKVNLPWTTTSMENSSHTNQPLTRLVHLEILLIAAMEDLLAPGSPRFTTSEDHGFGSDGNHLVMLLTTSERRMDREKARERLPSQRLGPILDEWNPSCISSGDVVRRILISQQALVA